MEDLNSLANFQIAGLLIQNSFRLLLSALKSYYKRKVLKSYFVWRHKTIVLPKAAQTSIKNAMMLTNIQTIKLLKLFKSKSNSTMQDVLYRIVYMSKNLEAEKKLQSEEEALKSHHQQELQSLTKELKAMQDRQDELERILKKAKAREESYKTQISQMNGKRNELAKTRKRNIKQNEEEILERIEELKEENTDIREKISLIENNVNHFISEMGGLLETSEEVEKNNEKRRLSMKKGKLGKKSRAPLFTLDLTKN